ncbi:MAG: tetratricopeptide repeat protein [Holophagales bacterium]|nr:tetratricopeptide repeat protein [Holophagales bacterium]
MLNLGNLYRKIGRPHEAIEACTLALGMTLELRGEDHPNVPRIRACLATAEAAAAGGPEG